MRIINIYVLLITFFLTNLLGNVTSNINLTNNEKEFIKNNPTIQVGAELDWPPFDYVENGEYKGIAKDYLDKIEKITGLKFKYHADTWPNLIQKIKDNTIDLLPVTISTESRKQYMNFTNSYFITRKYVYANSIYNDIQRLEDLHKKTIAVPKGYALEKFIEANYPTLEIYSVKNVIEAIDAIITKKADFFISNTAIVNHLIKKNNIFNIEAKIPFPSLTDRYKMATNKKQIILRNIIQKAIDSISTEDKNNIAKKWLNINELKHVNSTTRELIFTDEEKNYIKSNRKIVVANEYDWIPFDFNEENIPKGYVIDYIKLLSKKIGFEPIFITDKWSALISRFKKGEIDILPVISYTKKREEYMNYTKSFMNQELVLVTKESTDDIINIDDLKGKKIGMMKDWNITKILRKHYPDANIIEFESLNDVFDAIKNNFVEVTIQNKFIANFYINKDFRGYIKTGTKVKLPTHKNKLHMGVNKDLVILRNILNKGIESLKKEELEPIHKKWVNYGKEIKFNKLEKEFIQNNVINVTTTNNWAPFSFNDNDKLQGISYDFWSNIVEKANLKVNYQIKDNFSTVLKQIKEKKSDIAIATGQTKDRNNYAIFSDSITKAHIGIATLQDKNYISSAEELLGKKIAVGKNFTAHKVLEEKYPNMIFHFVKNAREGLNAVSNNDVFAYVDIMPVLSYNIRSYGLTNVKISGQTGFEFELKMMIRDDYYILKSIVNKVLKKMTLEEKQAIYKKWLEASISDRTDYSLIWKIIIVFLIILSYVIYKNRQLITYQKNLKRTQNELENSLDNFKSLLNLSIAGILIVRDNKIRYLNNEILNILNYTNKNNLLDMSIDSILYTETTSDIKSLINEKNESFEEKAIKKDGSKIPVLIKVNNISFDNIESIIISIIDLTDVKNKEELILQQSKMASLGEMIGNIAHQWRQPLSSISTAASGMKLQKEYGLLNDELFNESLDAITQTSKFLSQTIDDFRNYIKDDKEKNLFDLRYSIDKILTIMKGSFTNHFINIEIDVENIEINGYENEFNQVLLNILSNSKDALKTIKEDDRFIFIKSFQKEHNIILTITDTGGGIQTDVLTKIFEPYFTTKHKSQGTGLGLYMTHKIITESMGGNIIIENCSHKNFNKCTRVILSIPMF